MLKIIYGQIFARDIKQAKKRGYHLEKFVALLDLLIKEKSLPAKIHAHKLKGEYHDCWECHIEPDWLLIYQKTKDAIILIRTGSHSDLF